MVSHPITLLWLRPATHHEPHCQNVSINKIWKWTESTPQSGWWCSHTARIYSNCSTQKINNTAQSADLFSCCRLLSCSSLVRCSVSTCDIMSFTRPTKALNCTNKHFQLTLTLLLLINIGWSDVTEWGAQIGSRYGRHFVGITRHNELS